MTDQIKAIKQFAYYVQDGLTRPETNLVFYSNYNLHDFG